MGIRCFVLSVGLTAVLGYVPALGEDLPHELLVKLLVPLSTETSQKGDKLTAQVLCPEDYKGDFMEGIVDRSQSSRKMKGKSELRFSFGLLHHANQPKPIQSYVRKVIINRDEEPSNFRCPGEPMESAIGRDLHGVPDVDAEGNIIKTKNNIGKAAAATGAGALIGAVVGGGKGAAIGAGAGALASVILIQVAVHAPKLSFKPEETRFILSVKPPH